MANDLNRSIKIYIDNSDAMKKTSDLTDRIKSLEGALKTLDAQGKKDTPEYTKKAKALQGLHGTYDRYNKKVEDTTRVLNNLSGASKGELLTVQKEINKVIKEAARDSEEYKAALVSLKAVKKELALAMKEERLEMGKQNSAFSVLKGSLMVMAGNLMSNAIGKVKEMAVALKDWVAEGLQAAGVIEGVTRAFNKLDKTGDLLSKLQNQTRNLISDDDLKKATVRADKYKINIQEVGNLLEFAGRRAVDMGKNVTDFQERIIDGIGKESKLRLDDLGFTSTQINKAIAETGSFASGVIKIVNEDLAKQGKLELTAADIREQKTVAWANAQGEVGEKFLWLEKIWNKFSIEFANDIKEWAINTLPALIQKVIDMYNWFVELYNGSAIFRGMLNNIVLYYDVLWNATKKLLSYMINGYQTLGNVVKGVFTQDWTLIKNSVTKFYSDSKDLAIDFAKDAKRAWKDYADEVTNGQMKAYTKPADKTPNSPTGQTLFDKPDPDAAKKQKAAQLLALEEMETTHQKKLFDIKKQYSESTTQTEAEFRRKEFAQEQAYMLLREHALEEFIKQTSDKELKSDLQSKLAELQNKRLDQEIKFRGDLEKIILAADPVEKEKHAYQERLSALNLIDTESGAIKKKLTEEQHTALEILEKQHMENLEDIRKKEKARAKAKSEEQFEIEFKSRREELQLELNALMTNSAAMGKGGFSAEMEMHMKRLQMLQEEIKARKDAGLDTEKQIQQVGRVEAQMTSTINKELQKRAAQFQQYGNMVGQALSNVMTGQETALKSFGDASIDIVFDVLSKIIEAELAKVMATSASSIMRATAESMATPQSALSFGSAGFATAAILTGAITAATLVAKTALKGMLGKKKDSTSSTTTGSQSTGKVIVNQRARGKYDVIGTEDNKLYKNVPYAGSPTTGIVMHPTLYGEQGNELVVSSPDLRALQKHMNYPVIVQAINDVRANRVSQRADGNYSTINSSGYQFSQNSNVDMSLFDDLKGLLSDLRNNGVHSNIAITELQARQQWKDKVDSTFIIKK